MTTTATKPVFLYDDCCPLCRGYTKTFTALGWAERAPFSTVDEATLAALDMDRARHHIPLHDPNGPTRYGLDGIRDVVEDEGELLGRIGKHPAVRALLDRLYWFITYNRRHIITAAPPVTGAGTAWASGPPRPAPCTASWRPCCSCWCPPSPASGPTPRRTP